MALAQASSLVMSFRPSGKCTLTSHFSVLAGPMVSVAFCATECRKGHRSDGTSRRGIALIPFRKRLMRRVTLGPEIGRRSSLVG